jgi:leucyl aminopeptidase (aminopeptidase T)
MSINESVTLGAKQVIQRCLRLNPGRSLVIFFDETTIEISVMMTEIAAELGVETTAILVPVSLQRRIPHQIDLSTLTQGAAHEAKAILTCVNPMPDCLNFRKRILESQWSARTRIGHMPGASLEVLTLANVDIDQLVNDCRQIELAMARGKLLELITYEVDGTPHHLTTDIGGWERLPVASDGVIDDGVWGNVPSGETYIAPIEDSATGSVVINGSIPGLVLNPNTQLIRTYAVHVISRSEATRNP